MLPTPQDNRNVTDEFKGMSEADIRKILDERGSDLIVAMAQLRGDFNFSCVVRAANAFGSRDVYHIGPRSKWDRRGAVGTHHYTNVIHLNSWEALKVRTHGYQWVALENNVGSSISIDEFEWSTKTVLIIGEESEGLSHEVLQRCDATVTIPQIGSVRSLNAAVAAGIAMFSYNTYQKGVLA